MKQYIKNTIKQQIHNSIYSIRNGNRKKKATETCKKQH